MEDHHWGGQGWNSAVEAEEEENQCQTLAFRFTLC
jgi:hypothetical protein